MGPHIIFTFYKNISKSACCQNFRTNKKRKYVLLFFSVFVDANGTLDTQSITTLASVQTLNFNVPTFGLTVYEINLSFYFLTSDVLYNDINEVRYCVVRITYV